MDVYKCVLCTSVLRAHRNRGVLNRECNANMCAHNQHTDTHTHTHTHTYIHTYIHTHTHTHAHTHTHKHRVTVTLILLVISAATQHDMNNSHAQQELVDVARQRAANPKAK